MNNGDLETTGELLLLNHSLPCCRVTVDTRSDCHGKSWFRFGHQLKLATTTRSAIRKIARNRATELLDGVDGSIAYNSERVAGRKIH